MREKEKDPKLSGSSDKTKTKASTGKGASSKAPTASVKGPSAPKASSSSKTSLAPKASSKTSSSTPKASSSTPKASSKTASTKGSSSTSKPSASKAPASLSKTSSSTSKVAPNSKTSSRTPSTSKTPSTSSRPKPAASSSSSTSKSRPVKPTPSSTKTSSGGSRNSSSSKDDKSKGEREPKRGDRRDNSVTKVEKSSTKPAARGDRDSSNQSREKKPVIGRGDKKESKASTDKERGKERSSNSRSQRERSDTQKDSGKSRSSNDQDNTGRLPSAKSRSDKDNRKPNKEENNREERSRVKSSRSREKSAAKERSRTTNNEDGDAHDSGVEGMSIGQVTDSQNSNKPEVEIVEHAQNSLETMESGISLSSPRDLSGDEVDVEESISSRMVEVDEMDEVMKNEADMFDDESLSLHEMHGDYSAAFQFQNPTAASTAPLNDETAEENDVEETNDYEEDFEDYESDFEDDTGSGNEEEHLEEEAEDEDDSDDSEDDSDDDSEDEESGLGIVDPEIAAVLLALKEENNFEKRLQRMPSMDVPDPEEPSVSAEKTMLMDTISEHHEEPHVTEENHKQIPRPKTSRTFVNFAEAKKKQMAAQLSSKIMSRGRILLNMIELDTVHMDLLTLSPVSYEAYISSFGQSNRHQISIQTNDDALCEEVQTEEITTRSKWTQKPVHISIGEGGQLPGPEDYIGVGGDIDPLEYSDLPSKGSNTAKLTSFLISSSQVMLGILEEELVWDLADTDSTSSVNSSSEGLGFSHPSIPLGASVKSLLDKRPIPFVQFCATESTLLLSVHGYSSLDEDGGGELSESGLVCVWSVQEPSRPQHLLCSRAPPTAAVFSPSRPSLVLSGLEDGSLAAWDLREPLQLHTLKIDIDDVNWRVRVPSYVTACHEGDGEGNRIVAIQSVTTHQDLEMDTQGSFQVVTLTSDGRVTWWVVVRVPLTSTVADLGLGKKHSSYDSEESKAGVSPHLGAAPWARIALNRTATINVATTLYGEAALSMGINCHSLKLDPNDPNQLYVATGSGAVVRSSRFTSRINPKSYVPEIEPGCEALCLAICPHDARYLLVGSGDGVVRLHSTNTERPLTSWQSAPDSSPIVAVQWSPARPCVFYVLDSLSRLHVWDLSAGDIFPVLTVESGGLVGGSLHAFHIATTRIHSHHSVHAVFASDDGGLVLRQISPEFCTYEQVDDYNTELERFTYYVNII